MVSKVWGVLLGGTSAAWENVSIVANVDFRDGGLELDTVGMLLWFCRRAVPSRRCESWGIRRYYLAAC